jgi:hypothetical protein
MLDYGFAGDTDEGLGLFIRQGRQPCAESGSENDGLE